MTMTGIELIAKERERQISAFGFTAEHDDQHDIDELAQAACYYAWPGGDSALRAIVENLVFHNREWGKRETKSRIEQLVVAGALIAAEIDRLKRKEAADD